jgi:hypothetical protein
MTNKLAKIRDKVEIGAEYFRPITSAPSFAVASADLEEALALLDSLSAPDAKEGQGERGWTGRSCPVCMGTGERDPDGHSCPSCGGTGEEYSTLPAAPAPELVETRGCRGCRYLHDNNARPCYKCARAAPPNPKDFADYYESAPAPSPDYPKGHCVKCGAPVPNHYFRCPEVQSPSPKEVPMAMLEFLVADEFLNIPKGKQEPWLSTVAARYGYTVKE